MCVKTGHMAAKCPNAMEFLYFGCSLPGHVALDYPRRRSIRENGNSAGEGGCNQVAVDKQKGKTPCGRKDKPNPCMACGRMGHYTFECPGLQYLGRHSNLPSEFDVFEKNAQSKSGPERKEYFHGPDREAYSSIPDETNKKGMNGLVMDSMRYSVH